MKSFKRLVSLLLTAFLTLALFPLTAMAAAPEILNATVDQYRVTITFTEGVFGDSDASTPVEASDFQLTFTQNGGVITNASITSARSLVNGDLTGGETGLHLYLLLTPHYSPSGTETVEVKPANGSSIYNASGEAMSADATTGILTLPDMQPPAFASGFPRANTNVAPGSKIVVLEVSPTEPAFVHYVGLTHGAAAPSKAQVLAGTDSAGGQPIVEYAGTAKVSGISAYTIDMPDHNTTYDFYVVLTDDANNTCDPVMIELTTPDTGAPVVYTGSIYTNGTTSATFNGTLHNTGGEAATQHGFVYGTAPNPRLNQPGVFVTQLGPLSTPANYGTGVSGLMPDTTYYVCAYATNSKGTGYGDSVEFKTDAEQAPPEDPDGRSDDADRPDVVTVDVTDVTAAGATLTGKVRSTGGARVRERGFVYSTSPNPVTGRDDVERIPLGDGTGSFSTELAELMPATVYYARAYAINREGTAYGDVLRFETGYFGDVSNGIPKTGGAPALAGWLTLAVCSCTLPLLRRRNGR